MGNAAQNILDAMDRWNTYAVKVGENAAKVPIGDARQMESDSGVLEILALMRDLQDIREYLLAEHERTGSLSPYANYFNQWVHAVVSYPSGWKGAYLDSVIILPEAYLSLKLLAYHWSEPLVPDLDEVLVEGFRRREVYALDELLAEVDRLVTADPTLPEWVRDFVVACAQDVRDELDKMDRGEPHGVPAAVTQLLNAMLTASKLSTDEKRGWRDGAENWVRKVVADGASGYLTQGMVWGGNFVMQALTR